MQKIFGAALVCLAVGGCASSSADITAQYVSPLEYSNYSCEQIGAEAQRVSARASELAGVQDSKATSDSVAMGVGLVLFWPSLLFIKGDGQSAAELGRLKGEFETLQKVSIAKNCNLQFQQGTPPAKPTTTASITTP
jgi:hypothetical protein